jgi:hypothetical protein
MTPRQARAEQTQREIERGQYMSERVARVDLVEKWEKEKTILVAYGEYAEAPYGDRPTLVSVTKAEQTFREPTRIFPSKQMIADIYLALEFNK